MTPPPLRLLFASGESYLPFALGGAERSVDELLRALRARGHEGEVLAGLGRGAPQRGHRLWRLLTGARREARRDDKNGYPTHRAIPRRILEAFRERVTAARPDLVVVWNRASADLAREAAVRGIPSIVWVHDATLSWFTGHLPPEPTTRVIAVSEFLAHFACERLARPVSVLRPVLALDAVRATERRPTFVTMVNPRPEKGVDVALAVAERLPGRRFLLVGSDALPADERTRLAARVRSLHNVRVVARAQDMRAVYAETAVLLVPSRCEDAAPRVVLEAQANGIPVVASRVGGIPEIGGEGVALLPRDASIDLWADTIEGLLRDPRAHARLADAGRANAARPEFRPESVVEAFLALATDVRRATPPGVSA